MAGDPNTGALPPPQGAPKTLGADGPRQHIINALAGFRNEAVNARLTGTNPRDNKWRQNLDLYWNRWDWSDKADWQAKETMPEVPQYVDRFAGALTEALVAVPEGFYTVDDPADKEKDVSAKIKALNDMWLTSVATSSEGRPLGFGAFFEEAIKLGALTACNAVVTWKNDIPGGRVAMENVDPQTTWLDHTNRKLYRFRRTEIDHADLIEMARTKSSDGQALFNLDEIERLTLTRAAGGTADMEDVQKRRDLTGLGTETTSGRKPITLEEWVATVVDENGKLVNDARGQLYVVADNQYLLRGPEANPYWHNQDWMVYCPLVTAPLSPYGRSYMEDFGSIAKTFTELTNMILDAIHTTGQKAFALIPEALVNPHQAAEGVSPGKLFLVNPEFDVKKVAGELNLGTLDKSSVDIWQAVKNELTEAAGLNEMSMGQFAPKGRTSAMEINTVQQSSSARLRTVADLVENRFLDPILDLGWKTGMQHADFHNERVVSVLGEDWAQTFATRRRDFCSRPYTFKARGISAMIQKQQTLNTVLQLFQIIGANQNLAAAFMQKVDVEKVIALLFSLAGVDPAKITLSERDMMIRQVVNPMQQASAGGQPTPAGAASMDEIAQRMGVQ